MKNVVSVRFQSESYEHGRQEFLFKSRLYDYLNFDESIEIGDLVAVATSIGYKIAKVADIKEFSENANSPIIQKIDIDSYLERSKAIKEKRQLERKIEAEIASKNKLEMYKSYAADDPDLASLIEQYENLEEQKQCMSQNSHQPDTVNAVSLYLLKDSVTILKQIRMTQT